MSPTRRRAAALAALTGLWAACAGPPADTSDTSAASASEHAALAAQLVPSGSLRPGFTLRQRLRFRTAEAAGSRSASFEAVVQVDCREVLVVGLTPFHTRLFTLRQRGRETEFAWLLDEPWPFQPERILLDVHRSLLYPLADPPLADGDHRLRVFDVDLVETWAEGRLRRRTLDEADGGEPLLWVADYGDGWAPGDWPEALRLASARYGYTIEIQTIERRPLACAP